MFESRIGLIPIVAVVPLAIVGCGDDSDGSSLKERLEAAIELRNEKFCEGLFECEPDYFGFYEYESVEECVAALNAQMLAEYDGSGESSFGEEYDPACNVAFVGLYECYASQLGCYEDNSDEDGPEPRIGAESRCEREAQAADDLCDFDFYYGEDEFMPVDELPQN